MPIQIGDKIFRNIQEQVGKNQADISALKLAQTLGWKNIGTLDAASDIPRDRRANICRKRLQR